MVSEDSAAKEDGSEDNDFITDEKVMDLRM